MASCSAHNELLELVAEIEDLINDIAKDQQERDMMISELLG